MLLNDNSLHKTVDGNKPYAAEKQFELLGRNKKERFHYGKHAIKRYIAIFCGRKHPL